MRHRFLGSFMVLAAGLGLAACSTARQTNEAELLEAAETGQIPGASYVQYIRRGDDPFIRSGTIIRGKGGPKASESAANCARGVGSNVEILVERQPEVGECSHADRVWANKFAVEISALLQKVFAEKSPRFEIGLRVVASGEAVRLRHEDDMLSDPVSVKFAVRASHFALLARRVSTSMAAHELHHAAHGVIRARRKSKVALSPTVADGVLNEAAAELFGICATLAVDNIASRAEENHTIGDRPGGVLTDEEIKAFISDGTPYKKRKLTNIENSVIGGMLANSVWTSTIGPDYLAVGDSKEGDAMKSLCRPDTVSTWAGMQALLNTLASDGVDAPPFPAWSPEIGESYFRRYDEAHERWRAGVGLPAK